MRARVGIVVLIGGIVAFAAVSMYMGAVKAGAGTNSFARYYEPCNPDISFNFTDYQLPLDINDIVNLAGLGDIIDVHLAMDLICQNGFAVMDHTPLSSVDFIHLYEKLKYSEKPPVFVTTDTGLHLYHSIFDQTLRDIEEHVFYQDITSLTKELLDDALEKFNRLDGELKEAARRNVAYLSVAQKILDPDAAVPDPVRTEVNAELAKIEAHQGVIKSDIFKYSQDYSQFVPRGHYTQRETLKLYFKTMMWYGSMTFLLKGGPDGIITERDAKIQTMQACMLTSSLKNTKVGDKTSLDVWDRMYTVTAFFVGFADDLTPKDYLQAINKVFGIFFSFRKLKDEEKLFELKKELALLPSPEIYGGIGDVVVEGAIKNLDEILDRTKGMRLMGRRFIPDSYVFQHLTFPEVGNYTGEPNKKPFTVDQTFGNRSYIRGLDFMAVLGSSEAMNILIEEGDSDFDNYDRRFNELKGEFDSFNIENWNRNLYWSWLYCLKGLMQELPEEYPNLMRIQAWQRSRLNASLASWTQLRHDTIFYGKLNLAPPPFMPRVPPGYVESNPVFWGRLLSLTRMTRSGLESFNIQSNHVMVQKIYERLDQLEDFLQGLLDIVIKQLAHEPLSDEDKRFFMNLSDTVFDLSMDRYTQQSTDAIIVADVHTFSSEQTVVEEGVGYVDIIVVACPLVDGKAFLAAGPVFSYYEFKHPMKDRLTDEAWGKMFEFRFPDDGKVTYEQWLQDLKSRKKPERPKWYQPLMRQNAKSSSK